MNSNLITPISSIPCWKANNGKDLINAVNKMPGVLVKDLKYSDLMLPANQCNGVYLFMQGNNHRIIEKDAKGQQIKTNQVYWYVGKAGGRSLVDRIGAHFAPRHDDYMNSLLKNIAWLLSNYKIQKEFLNSKDIIKKNNDIEKALNVIQDLYIKVITFDVPNNQGNLKSDIAQAESMLIKGFRPLLNNVNRKPRILKMLP